MSKLVLRLLRDERDRIERAMDLEEGAVRHYPRMPWFDYDEWSARMRLELAMCNAEINHELRRDP
jgi:hypothetical protein